jgi:hypothetical protein
VGPVLNFLRVSPLLAVLATSAPVVAAKPPPRVAVLEFTGDGARHRAQVISALRARHFRVLSDVSRMETVTQVQATADRLGLGAIVEGSVTGTGRRTALVVRVRGARTGVLAGTATFAGDRKRLEWDIAHNFWKRLGPSLKQAARGSARGARVLTARRADAHMEPTGQPLIAARRASSGAPPEEEDEPLAPHAPVETTEDDQDDDGDPADGAPTESQDLELHRRLDPAAGAPTAAPSFDLALGMHLFTRHFYYRDPIGTLTPYRLLWAPAPAGALDWFPFTHGGLTARGQIETGATTTDRDGTSFPTAHWEFSGGVKGRLPLGSVWLSAASEYGIETFRIDSAAPGTPKPPVPSVRYQYVRAGGIVQFNATSYLTLVLTGGYRHVFSAGEVASDLYFPHASVTALDASATLAIRLSRGLELRIGSDVRRYDLQLRSRPGDVRKARAAVDDYVGGTVSLAVLVGGKRGF